MASTGFTETVLAHANQAFASYDGNIIGRLENLKMRIDKDVEYDSIIGSGGKPFGNPIIKHTKYYGTFTKGMFKISELDKILMLDAIGNEHADPRADPHDNSDFSSNLYTKFIDTSKRTLTLFPVTFGNLAIAFGGVTLKVYEIEVVSNKFIRINGEFIAKFMTYFNNLQSITLSSDLFRKREFFPTP